MKLSFKFFTWRVNLRTENLKSDERIVYLANQIIKEIQATGKSIAHPTVSPNFGSLDIIIYRFGQANASLEVQDIINGWNITGTPTFKTLEGK